MAKIITQNNVLNPLDRTTKIIDCDTCYDLLKTVDYDRELYNVVVARNDVIIDGDFKILDGDIINVSIEPRGGGGGGKNILRTVAMVAVAVVAPSVGLYALNTIGASTALSAASAYGIMYGTSAAFVIGGSMLVNAVLPPQTPDLNFGGIENIKQSPTYSWERLGNSTEEGIPVPVLYGTARVTPPLISKFIDIVDNKQYLNLLYAVADGETFINENSIKINGEPITNFSNIDTYIRNGDNNQNIIPLFDDVRTDKSINRKISTEYITTTTDGNSASGLDVILLAPKGIYYVADNGDIVDNTLEVIVEYERDGAWIPITSSEGIDFNSPILGYWQKLLKNKYGKYDTIDGINCNDSGFDTTSCPSPLEISSTPPVNSIYKKVDGKSCYVEYQDTITNVFEVITRKEQNPIRLSYKINDLPPDTYNIRVKFNTQPQEGSRYGSDLVLEAMQEIVTDDFTYPNTALMGLRILATDQLQGNLPQVSTIATNATVSNNPSDVAIDILKRSGVTLSAQELVKFTEWKNFCNEKNYTCNIYFDQDLTVRKALDLVGLLGRGNVLQFGSQYSVIIDKADELPVQQFMFTMGNINKDSFSQSFLPIQDRTNRIDITYWDKDLDYSPTIVEVSNAEYDKVDQVNRTSISYVGCTDRDMAIRYAKYLLNCARYLTITQTFEVDTEAIKCRLGDIIKVAHDVPQIGQGGRIVSATINTVTIDRQINLIAGINYYIEIRDSQTGNIITKEVLNTEVETDTLTMKTNFSEIPEKFDIYSVGEINKTTKKMRVINISKAMSKKSIGRSRITALEYIEDVYNDDATIIPITQSDFGLKGLSLNEIFRYKNTSVVTDLEIAWRGNALWYDVFLNGELLERSYDTRAVAKNIDAPKNYNVKVVDSLGNELVGDISTLGRFAPPEPPTNFKVEQFDQKLRMTWDKSVSLDTARYEIRHGLSWENAFKIGISDQNNFEWFPDMNATYKFWIKSIDYSDVYSSTSTSFQINVSNIDTKLNSVITYNGVDKNTPVAGSSTEGMIFVVGKGYIPIQSATYDDLGTTTYDDLGTMTYDDTPTFESGVLDMGQIGTTKIRLLSSFTATNPNATYEDIGNRTYDDFPYDTYNSISVIVGMDMYYSISDDNITYSENKLYKGIVDEDFRYIKVSYSFQDISGEQVEIDEFKAILDVPDIEYDIINENVINTKTITHSNNGYSFYSKPFVSPTSKSGAIYPVITNETASSFDVSMYDSSGNLTTGNVDIKVKGY